MFLSIIVINTFAQKRNESKSPIIGSWKFTRQSTLNDFQKVFKEKSYQAELFTFSGNQTFKHEFVDASEQVIKVLKGKWKIANDKIQIKYADVDYEVYIDYFFLESDLVLGQNFSHVIFKKLDNEERNLTMK